MPISSRDLVRRCLDCRPTERRPIVMHFGQYAARLQQLSYQQAANDATLLANALQSAQRLFGCDGMIILADSTLEAEACGCAVEWRDDLPVVTSHPLEGDSPADIAVAGIETVGRLAVALEAARRLEAVIGKDVALLPAVTGPATLAGLLRGPTFLAELAQESDGALRALDLGAQVAVHVAKQYLQMGIHLLVVVDPLLGRLDQTGFVRVASSLRTMWNVADFFDARVLLQTEMRDGTNTESLVGLGAGGLILEGGTDLHEAMALAGKRGPSVGAALPVALMKGALFELETTVAAWRDGGMSPCSYFACTDIPREVPPENVHTVVRLLRTKGE
jgi:uroporphyrinogen-III decarboxylase